MALPLLTSLALASSQDSVGVSSLATGSVSPPSDCLLVVAGCQDSGAGTGITMSTTLANVGAWTVVATADYATNDKTWIAYAKVTGAPGSGTVTASFSTNLVDAVVYRLFYITGHNTTTPVPQSKTNTGTAATATVTLTSTPAATSQVFAVTGQIHGTTAGSQAMVPSGTEINQDYLNNTSFNFDIEAEMQYVNGSAGTTHTVGTLGAPAAWGIVAIEIAASPPNAPAIQDRDRRGFQRVRDRWATRDRGRQQRSQFDLYRSTSVAAASADVSVAGLLPLAADLWAPISHDVPVAGILPAGATPIGTVSHAANVAGLLPAAAVPLSTVSHDAALVGLLPAAAAPIGTISHDATLAGLLPAAVAPISTISHAATVAGILPVGAVPLATFTHDATVAGLLFVGAVPLATVSHDASVAGLLPVAAVPYGPVSHTATVAGLLPLGAIFLSQLAGDLSTIGVLYAGLEGHGLVSHAATVAGILHVGAVPASPVTHDAVLSGLLPAAALPYATVSRTTSVAGVLPVGLTAIGTVTHQVALVGLLPVGGVLYALVTVAGPDAPDLHPILWIYREAGPLHFTESGLLYVEAATLEADEGPRLTGRDLWITYRETP
jgi:hypothetical protein